MSEHISTFLFWLSLFALIFIFQGEPDLWDAWTHERDTYIQEKLK